MTSLMMKKMTPDQDLFEFTKRVVDDSDYLGIMLDGPLDGQVWRILPDSEVIIFHIHQRNRSFECAYEKSSIHSLFTFNYDFLYMERL